MRRMDDNEAEAVQRLLNLAKLAIIAMMVVGGYLGRGSLVTLL